MRQFGIEPKDVVHVTNAPLYEYNKILTAIYRTLSVVGVVKGQLRLRRSSERSDVLAGLGNDIEWREGQDSH